MPSERPNDHNAELLNDFFSECDEHLTEIRHRLVQLEECVGKAQTDRTVVEGLFRAFHSLKGIAAIVGLRSVEDLAHGTEDYLRDLMKGRTVLNKGGFDLLMAATQGLEKSVFAFRSGEAVHGHEAVLDRIKKACSSEDAKAPEASKRNEGNKENGNASGLVEGARARGLVIWQCNFKPSRELDARGVNINSVRARLGAAGEILHSSPKVLPGGGIAFEFLVGMRESPSTLEEWEADGITVELVEQPAGIGSATASESTMGASDESANPFIAPSHVVRVDMKRLDELMRITGEMVIHRSRFDQEISQATRQGQTLNTASLQEINTRISKSLRELREAIMRVRLVSVAEIFARMPFVVRDLARESDKKVRLKLEGQQTEIDKYLIEQLKDPLLHIVRNAFSHGVETPEERRRLGKPDEATIVLAAATMGDSVIIRVRDDGRGINAKKVAARARDLGMEVNDQPDNSELLQILCSPGFSTREDADRASGRGVGMAVVHTKMRELGGSLSLETVEDKGTQFTLRLPLTLAIAEVLVVTSAGQTCAVPQSFVSEVIQVRAESIRAVNGVEVAPYRSGVLPLLRLARLFHVEEARLSEYYVLVLTSDKGQTGLLVEAIAGQKEVLVRTLRDPLIQVEGVAGATEMGDGRPVLILDAAMLTSGAVRPHANRDEEKEMTAR